MSIAHWMTFLRILTGPIFLFLYANHEQLEISLNLLPYLLLVLLGVSELSDAVDGYLARKFNQVTDFGKIFDPMADSIYRLSVFLTFTLPPIELPMVFIFLFLYRDSMISTLRTVCALKGFALGARRSGKLKAIIQATAALIVVSLLIPFSEGYISQETLHLICTNVVGVAAFYSFFSGIEYIYAHWASIQLLLKRTA